MFGGGIFNQMVRKGLADEATLEQWCKRGPSKWRPWVRIMSGVFRKLNSHCERITWPAIRRIDCRRVSIELIRRLWEAGRHEVMAARTREIVVENIYILVWSFPCLFYMLMPLKMIYLLIDGLWPSLQTGRHRDVVAIYLHMNTLGLVLFYLLIWVTGY